MIAAFGALAEASSYLRSENGPWTTFETITKAWLHSMTMQVLQSNLTKPTSRFLGGKTEQEYSPDRNRTKYAYVDNMPTMHVDPFGLIKWTGDFEIEALSAGIGVARVVFNLESECVAGQMVRIDDWTFWAFQTDFGLPLGAIKGDVSLEDGLSSRNRENLNHQNLEGDFNANGIGPTIGPFGLPTSINLGKGTGLGWGKGLDLSLLSGASAGNLRIPREQVRYLECPCE